MSASPVFDRRTLSRVKLARPSKRGVFLSGKTRIFLRSDLRWSSPVEKGYDHPVAIAPVRLSSVLSRIDVRPPQGWLPTVGDEKQRVPALETEQIQTIAEGLAKALGDADENQEVVVMAVRETKRFGIFDHDYLTSFVVYARDERLYIHFSYFDWEIPDRRDERLPEPRVGRQPQRFNLYPGTGLTLIDRQSVAVDWRDPVFAEGSRIRVGPDGELRRREILMEDPEVAVPPAVELPSDLSPEQLRALADLEEDRRAGRITEADYRTRRRQILAGD